MKVEINGANESSNEASSLNDPQIATTVREFELIVKEIIEPLQIAGIIPYYRGHGCIDYKIVPTICRMGLSISEILKFESNLFINFSSKIINNNIGQVGLSRPAKNIQYLDQWYLLYQMRHLEIPSRLIDWSFDKYISLYFCVSDERCKTKDGNVWIYPSIKHFDRAHSEDKELSKFSSEYVNLNAGDVDQQTLSGFDPFNPEKILMVHNILRPQAGVAEQRRMRQRGKFVLYPNHKLLESMNDGFTGRLMRNIIIPADAKVGIQKELEQMRVVNENVLPPIDTETLKIIQGIIEMSKA